MESIESALESGDLESRDGNFMGKTYRKLLRHQVEKLADKLAEREGGGEGGRTEEERKASKSNGGEGRKRLAEIEDQLKKIEEKKRKLLDEKKSLEAADDE